MSASPLTPLIVSAEPLLRAIKAGGHDSLKALAEAAGRLPNHIHRDLKALIEAALIERPAGAPAHAPRLTPTGEAGLAALDRAVAPDPRSSSDAPQGGAIAPNNVHWDQLLENPDNPRKIFDEGEIAALAETIADKGLLQPILLRSDGPGPDGSWVVEAGERRRRAIGLLVADGRWEADRPVPVRISGSLDEGDVLENALIENLQRADMAWIDEALAFRELKETHGRSTAQIARLIGSPNKQRMVQQYIQVAGRMSEDQVRRARLPRYLPEGGQNPQWLGFKEALAEVQEKREPAAAAKAKAAGAFEAARDAAEARITELVARLPEDQDELDGYARHALARFDRAVREGDDEALAAAREALDAVVRKLNGGEHFGSADAKRQLAERLAAAPGEVPMWGQPGRFVIDVDGMRIGVVSFGFAGVSDSHSVHFHVVNPDRPFMSETGYRAHFSPWVGGGVTVAEALEAELRGRIGAGKDRWTPVAVEASYRERRAAEARDLFPFAFAEPTARLARSSSEAPQGRAMAPSRSPSGPSAPPDRKPFVEPQGGAREHLAGICRRLDVEKVSPAGWGRLILGRLPGDLERDLQAAGAIICAQDQRHGWTVELTEAAKRWWAAQPEQAAGKAADGDDADTDAWDRTPDQVEADRQLLADARALNQGAPWSDKAAGFRALLERMGLTAEGGFAVHAEDPFTITLGPDGADPARAFPVVTVDQHSEWPDERAEALTVLLVGALNRALRGRDPAKPAGATDEGDA